MASAAPSMGLRRGHIGFLPIFRNFRQKYGFRWISKDLARSGEMWQDLVRSGRSCQDGQCRTQYGIMPRGSIDVR